MAWHKIGSNIRFHFPLSSSSHVICDANSTQFHIPWSLSIRNIDSIHMSPLDQQDRNSVCFSLILLGNVNDHYLLLSSTLLPSVSGAPLLSFHPNPRESGIMYQRQGMTRMLLQEKAVANEFLSIVFRQIIRWGKSSLSHSLQLNHYSSWLDPNLSGQYLQLVFFAPHYLLIRVAIVWLFSVVENFPQNDTKGPDIWNFDGSNIFITSFYRVKPCGKYTHQTPE